MTTTASRYEYFTVLHNNFKNLYPTVNHRVLNLYNGPKKFILETSPAIDRFLKSYAIPGQPGSMDIQRREMLDFIRQVDQFTRLTVYLFNLHKVHVDRCRDYLEAVSELDALNKGRTGGGKFELYISLTPQLVELHSGLRELNARAEVMDQGLDELKKLWQSLEDKFNT